MRVPLVIGAGLEGRVVGRGRGFGCVPSKAKASAQRLFADAVLYANLPLRATVRKANGVTAITGLCGPVRPSAVSGFVVPSAVDAVKGQTVGVSVGKRPLSERLKRRHPFIANANSLVSIVLNGHWVGFDRASAAHTNPDFVKSRSGHIVGQSRAGAGPNASAPFGRPSGYASFVSRQLASANASENPLTPSNVLKGGPSAKLLAGNIYECGHNANLIVKTVWCQ